jgi:hypothetical protein
MNRCGRACAVVLILLSPHCCGKESAHYKPVTYPNETDIAKVLCADRCVEASDANKNACFENVMAKSDEVTSWMDAMTEHWLSSKNDACLRPEEAFRKSMLNQGHTKRLAKFANKLESCEKDDNVTISLVVFGGSETAGNTCQSKGNPIPTDFLKLPANLSSPIILGNEQCPWANRLFTLLSKAYPKCAHIDVYNLAHGATDSTFALDHIQEWFSLENGARYHKQLGEVVDLVLVEYAVNDGLVNRDTLGNLRNVLEQEETNYLAVREAVHEYFMNFVKKLPNDPAIVYVETGTPESVFNPTLAHLDAAQRYGVPAVSVRHMLSFPDNPAWKSFSSHDDISGETILSEFGYYPDDSNSDSDITPYIVQSSGYSFIPGKEIPTESGSLHNFVKCWGYHTHPGKIKHCVQKKKKKTNH